MNSAISLSAGSAWGSPAPASATSQSFPKSPRTAGSSKTERWRTSTSGGPSSGGLFEWHGHPVTSSQGAPVVGWLVRMAGAPVHEQPGSAEAEETRDEPQAGIPCDRLHAEPPHR